MKKVLVLLAMSFFLVSANYAQTDSKNGRRDTTGTSQKTMKKTMHKGKQKMDSATNGNGTLSPMNDGTGRADSTNNGTIIPNQTPAQPLNPTQNPSQTPNPSTVPGTSPTTNPTQTPAPHK